MPTILVLCTGNSCRSHLAEGILKKELGDAFRIESAGSKPAGYVHPLAIKALAEIGIDISGNRSKHLDEFSMTISRRSSPYAAMRIRHARCFPAK